MNRTIIWVETIATGLVYVLAIWLTNRYVVQPRLKSPALAVALAFAIVQVVAILTVLITLLARKTIDSRRAARSAQLQGAIQQALALETAGQDQLRNLRSLMKQSRRDVERGIGEFLATVRGDASDRIVAVAKQLGVETPDEARRFERLFAAAATGNLLVRAKVTEELEPMAAKLAPAQITKALTSMDVSRVLAALNMVWAWKRVLPVGNVEPLIQHANPTVRAAALRALPWVESIDAQRSIRIGLRDINAAVRIAAAEAAARMQVVDALPQLVENLTGHDRDVSLASAFALASLPGGTAVLEKAISSPNRGAASVAFEALEKATMQRLELA